MNGKALNTLIDGVDHSLSDEAKRRLEQSVRVVTRELDDAKQNRTSNDIFGNTKSAAPVKKNGATDSELYTNISEMINNAEELYKTE